VTPQFIKYFEDLADEFYVRVPPAGRNRETSDKRRKPNSIDELSELLDELPERKLYKDKSLTIEFVLKFFDISPSSTSSTSTPSSKSTIVGCKEHFLNHSIPELHYVYKDGLNELYNDTFREAVIQKLLLEIKNESNRKFDANIVKIASVLLGEKESSSWIAETVIPQISNQQMLKRYIEYGITDSKIALGLELLDPSILDMVVLKHYDQEVDKIRKRFTLIEDEIERNILPVKQKAVRRVIDRMKNTGEWVLINAQFLVEKTSSNEFCFEFVHPVSNYWGATVKIVILEIPETDFTNSYRLQYSKLVGRKKQMSIFGHVFQPLTDFEPFDFMVTPYAIF